MKTKSNNFENCDPITVRLNELLRAKRVQLDWGKQSSVCERFREPLRNQRAVILGGQTTVEIRGTGVGGRNQETALAALGDAGGLHGAAMATFGTDSTNGNSPAAGALIHGDSVTRARRTKLDLRSFMERNDLCNYFRSLQDNIVTGPTQKMR